MASRYDLRRTAVNSNIMYDSLFKNRGINYVEQYRTGRLRYPTAKEIGNLTTVNRTWRRGDHYYKLASEYYANPTYWWVIAHFNQKPLESEIKFGDIIRIPTPLELVLTYYGV
mgnify:FL=1|jgi:nucleoid-associated protein YgaU|tara:strand:- start:381 stop:719 length:339 start_codon:yes stop_codon:yes gene_type:complete